MKRMIITLKEGTSVQQFDDLTKMLEKEGSFIGSDFVDNCYVVVFDADKSKLYESYKDYISDTTENTRK